MRFDDRIATLLTLPGSDGHDVAIRWRQLVDVVARAGAAEVGSAPFVAGLAVIRADRQRVPLAVRAASARSIAGRPLPDDLIELFASDALAVNAPLIAAAPSHKALQRRLYAVADNDTRQFIETLHPGYFTETEEGPTLGDVVARVEQRRVKPEPEGVEAVSQRPEAVAAVEAQRHPARAIKAGEQGRPELPALFRWETDVEGSVNWVDALPRAAMIGRSLAGERESRIADAMAARASFVDEPLAALGATWHWTGEPEFDQSDGRFLGYRGFANRHGATIGDVPTSVQSQPEEQADIELALPQDQDTMRELVHEIRTPLNAIIGFAEIIDGQYLGPANRQYRERAAEIVAQARILLGAIEDMDFAARQRFTAPDPGQVTDMAMLGPWIDQQLRPLAERAAVVLRFEPGQRDFRCAVDDALLKRLVKRLVAGLIAAADAEEILTIRLELQGNRCSLIASRPRALAGMTETRLLDPALTLEGEGKALLGVGFSLRLVRGLARLAGGNLLIDEREIALDLPALS